MTDRRPSRPADRESRRAGKAPRPVSGRGGSGQGGSGQGGSGQGGSGRGGSGRGGRDRSGLLIVGAAAALALAISAALPLLRPAPDLRFQPLASPEGFRTLAGMGGGMGAGGAADPFAGLAAPAGSPPAPAPDAPLAGAALCAALHGAGPAMPGPTTDAATTDAAAPDAPAPVRAVVLTDHQCPHCRRLDPILADLAAEGALEVTVLFWPVFGPASRLAALGALAAERQGGFAALNARLMRSGFQPTQGYLDAVAAETGLDPAALRADMADPALAAALDRNARVAAAFGLRGVPAVIVGGTLIPGAADRALIRAVAQAEENEGAGRPAPGPC
jgi:protein-disulfide isomerase